MLNFISLIYFFILHRIFNTSAHSFMWRARITVFPVKYGIYSISHFGTVILMYPYKVQHFISVTHAQTHNIRSLFSPASINLSVSLSVYLSLILFLHWPVFHSCGRPILTVTESIRSLKLYSPWPGMRLFKRLLKTCFSLAGMSEMASICADRRSKFFLVLSGPNELWD